MRSLVLRLLSRIVAAVFAVLLLSAAPALAQRSLTAGAVASPDRYGALAAEEILKAGGNAARTISPAAIAIERRASDSARSRKASQ